MTQNPFVKVLPCKDALSQANYGINLKLINGDIVKGQLVDYDDFAIVLKHYYYNELAVVLKSYSCDSCDLRDLRDSCDDVIQCSTYPSAFACDKIIACSCYPEEPAELKTDEGEPSKTEHRENLSVSAEFFEDLSGE